MDSRNHIVIFLKAIYQALRLRSVYTPLTMKEFEVKAQIDDQGLTKPIGPSTLDVRGPRQMRGKDIFMAEGNGEQPPKQPEPVSGAGGGSPPEKPPVVGVAGGGDDNGGDDRNNESEQPADEGESRLGLNINKEGVTDEKILRDIRGAEAGYAQASTLDERLNVLKDAYQKIIQEDVVNEQKDIGLSALQEYIDILKAQKDLQLGAVAAEKELSQKEKMEASNQARQMRETILNPDLSYVDKLQEIEDIINGLDPTERIYPHVIAMAIGEIEARDFDYIIEDTLEYSLERFLNRADAQPLEEYPQFTFTENENIAILTHTARRFDEARKKAGLELGINPGRREMFTYLTTLTNRRKVMHELFKSMNDLESYTGLVTRALRKSGMSFIEKQLVGVSDVQMVYDQVLLSLKSLKPAEQGWLLEDDYEIGDKMVKELLDESAKHNSDDFNKRFIRNSGTPEGVADTRPLRQWEIDRAFHMGRDLSAASQRRVVYGILGDVPENVDDFLKSLVHEPIARRLAPFKTIPERFFSQGIAKRFLSIFKDEQRRNVNGEINYNKYGYIRDGKPVGLFGSSQGDFAILDLEITDPKSSSWRSRLLYLKNSRFQTEVFSGKQMTLGAYLDATKAEYVRGKSHREKSRAISEWNEAIRDRISSQRLFLGVLTRYPDLDAGNKTAIWNNVAQFMPSRIASLLPNETLEIVDSGLSLNGDRDQAVLRWMGIAKKLWTAERMRVGNDAKVLSGEVGEHRDLDYYFEKVGLTDVAEIAIVRQIQELGENFAPTLANVKFPFTAFLDNAPETDWERLSDFDFTRILVSDQNSFQEGYGPIIGLFDNPVHKPEEIAKVLQEAFDKIKIPPGVQTAQKIFEPIVKSTIKMRQMFTRAKWMGTTLSRLLRIPTSPIEEYNLSAHVADDENDVAGMLHVLAQHEVLSDDPNQADEKGRTQFMRVKEELGADKLAVLLAYVRLIIQLFGPAFGMEFLKAMGIKLQ